MIAAHVPPWARMVTGVLVSGHGTMRRSAELGARYPEASKVAEIVASARASAPFVHYNSRLDEPLSCQLLSVVQAFPELKGIQVNVASPDPGELAEFKARRPDVELVVHGTTIGLNAIIQRRGAKLALVVSRGNRDVMEIARLRLPSSYDVAAPRDGAAVVGSYRNDTG